MSKEVGYRDATASKNGYGLCTLFSCIHRILALFIIIILFFAKSKMSRQPWLAWIAIVPPPAGQLVAIVLRVSLTERGGCGPNRRRGGKGE